MIKLLIVCFLFLLQGQSYNIVVNEKDIKFIRPSNGLKTKKLTPFVTETTFVLPVTTSYNEISGSKEREPKPPPLAINPTPTKQPINLFPVEGNGFFGYDISLSVSSLGARLAIGVPKRKYQALFSSNATQPIPEATGNILRCPLQNLFNDSQSLICHSITPPSAKPSDSFGMSVEASQEYGFRTCSTIRTQNCTVALYTPGYCYHRTLESQKWIQDTLSKDAECPLSTTLDLVFLLDGSDSVGKENFFIVKSWVIQVAERFNIKDGSTRIGVIQYSHFFKEMQLNEQPYIKTEIILGQYKNKAKFSEAVENLSLFGFTTYTANALNKSIQDFKTSDRFNSSAKVLILLTDGRSSDSMHLASSAAHVRSLGINTIAVGVGNAQVKELRIIATGTPTDRNIFYVSRFEQLNELVNFVKASILTFVLEGSQRSSEKAVNLLQFAQIGFSIASRQDNKSIQVDHSEVNTNLRDASKAVEGKEAKGQLTSYKGAHQKLFNGLKCIAPVSHGLSDLDNRYVTLTHFPNFWQHAMFLLENNKTMYNWSSNQ